jgi:hypothetical protein
VPGQRVGEVNAECASRAHRFLVGHRPAIAGADRDGERVGTEDVSERAAAERGHRYGHGEDPRFGEHGTAPAG